ncbi:Tyrosine--tRNA ligase [Frankliniella fusca]|uniref:Tyrosine--tRNA ligase n=1 Tax=Frankliniella fusca TaxID=407009 RepID=A0AAE1HMU3_9NEOP|nr:Tyrosine--tRNA ligase [Frankliniella fusca]
MSVLIRSNKESRPRHFSTIDIEAQVKYNIQRCLTKLNSMCPGCTGDHSLWFIAAGYTNFYRDVDVYVYCNGDIKSSTRNGYPSLAVLTFNHPYGITQIIRVNFDWNLDLNSRYTKLQLYALHVIENFDIPMCRVALIPNLTENCSEYTYVIDMAAISSYKIFKEERLQKYKERKVPDKLFHVPSLKLLAARAILTMK